MGRPETTEKQDNGGMILDDEKKMGCGDSKILEQWKHGTREYNDPKVFEKRDTGI